MLGEGSAENSRSESNRIATYAPVAAAAIHQIGATRRQNAITERANKIGWAKTEEGGGGASKKNATLVRDLEAELVGVGTPADGEKNYFPSRLMRLLTAPYAFFQPATEN